MFMFAFFSVVFSTFFWLIYAIVFVRSHLGEISFNELAPEDMLTDLAIVFLPVFVVWIVLGYANQFIINRGMLRKQNEVLKQLQKNQDYTDLVVRVMLDAEHEIKDGFVLNKFDVFISDMNEALGEIIQRCNIASSAQLEQLWLRVRRGEKWTLGKAILEASKNQSTFDAWVKEKVNRDKVFRGSLLEFCSRYQNLLQLLEKHDRDRVFIRMIEEGVFGKVYSIIAPLSEGVFYSTTQEKPSRNDGQDYESILKIATIEEPKADETIINVDKTDDEEEEIVHKESFFSRLNPFKRREEDNFVAEEPDDPFFKALHSSFKEDDEKPNVHETNISFGAEPSENYEVQENATEIDFMKAKGTLESLRNANETFSEINITNHYEPISASSGVNRKADNERLEPVLNEQRTAENVNNQQEDEDLIYPFGGWTDEKNYTK